MPHVTGMYNEKREQNDKRKKISEPLAKTIFKSNRFHLSVSYRPEHCGRRRIVKAAVRNNNATLIFDTLFLRPMTHAPETGGAVNGLHFSAAGFCSSCVTSLRRGLLLFVQAREASGFFWFCPTNVKPSYTEQNRSSYKMSTTVRRVKSINMGVYLGGLVPAPFSRP